MPTSRPKQILRILLLVGTAISLFFVPWLLVWAWVLPLPETIQDQAQQAVEHGFEGVIVYVQQGDQPPQYAAAGWHNREKQIPAYPEALYKIASISKLYDAVVAAKLASAGRLSLDKTVADYLPELKDRIEYADEITLRHMIQHRSGIPNFTDAPNFWGEPGKTYEESLALILDKPANFKPGEDYEYCNTNYLLLDRITQNTLGYDKFDFIQKEVLDRLGLRNTYPSLAAVPNIDSVMSGYHVGYPDDLKEDEYGMLATAEDVGIFVRALNDGSLFDGDEAEIYASIYEYEHGGWVPGYQSFTKYHEDIDAVTVEFYNTTDPKLYNWNLSEIINNRIVKIIEKQP